MKLETEEQSFDLGGTLGLSTMQVGTESARDQGDNDRHDHEQNASQTRHEPPAKKRENRRQKYNVRDAPLAIEVIESARHHPRKDDNQTHADDRIQEWDVGRHNIRLQSFDDPERDQHDDVVQVA